MSTRSERQLFKTADGQHGFFTTAQAEEAGYRDNVHSYHLRNGDWSRVRRGIYRLVQYPDTGCADLEVARLWTRNREGVEEGVFSHQTAEELHGEAKPGDEVIHVTVPHGFRRNSKPPEGVILHKSDIADEDIEVIDGFRVTGLRRTVSDLEAEGVPLNTKRPTSNIEHRSTENSDSAGARHPALSDVKGPPAAGKDIGGTTSVSSGKRTEKRQGSSKSGVRSRPSVAQAKPKPKSKPEPAREWGGAKIW